MVDVNSYTKIIQVHLEKERGDFGFTLCENKHAHSLKTCSLAIRNISKGGSADRDGRMKVGDRLLAIDNTKVANATVQDAMLTMNHVDRDARFTIEYDVCIIECGDNLFGPILVELEKLQGLPLGITVAHSPIERNAIIIESIKQASIADRCGALHINDQVLAINDVAVSSMSLLDVSQMLQFSVSEKLKMQILPIGQLYIKHAYKSPMITQGLQINNNICMSSSFVNSSSRSMLQTQGSSSNVSLASESTTTLSSNRISRCETMDVVLHNSCYTFGFAIQYATNGLTSFLVIANVDPEGPAARTNVLQVGDRLLAVNGISTKNMSVEEVTKTILDSQPTVKLLIEFNVAEYLFLNSCTFIVKVAKIGRELGITITTSQNQFDHSLLIANVKKGSVAYRTGIIHAGDYIIAINDMQMDSCTPENAIHLLQTCGRIVKLHIRKGKLENEDDDDFCYAVEIARRGRPLGLTMSGSENPFDPIVITNLINGGLAEQSGSLHVGDRIVAINETSLHGKTLSETISILQNAEDIIKLKIQKKTVVISDHTPSEVGDTKPTGFECSGNEGSQDCKSSERLNQAGDQICSKTTEDIEWEAVIKKFEDCSKQLSEVYMASNMESRHDQIQKYPKDLNPRSQAIANFEQLPFSNITLFKDKIYEDFGFSVSDGAYEHGVYINRIRPDGPADLSGILQPSDRIMQVNGVNTIHYDCCLTVPLMAAAGDEIELVIARSPYRNQKNEATLQF
uniref:PDZ domain-containing protein n=1 Tax=Strigamia maritima TaxID=126957 RepID=T1JDC7_STRMM